MDYVLTGTRPDRGRPAPGQRAAATRGRRGALWGAHYDLARQDLLTPAGLDRRAGEWRLAVRMNAVEQERLFRRYTDNVAAYEVYLRGRSELARVSEDGTRAAVAAFERALALDTTYALARAGLAMASADMHLRFATGAEVKRVGRARRAGGGARARAGSGARGGTPGPGGRGPQGRLRLGAHARGERQSARTQSHARSRPVFPCGRVLSPGAARPRGARAPPGAGRRLAEPGRAAPNHRRGRLSPGPERRGRPVSRGDTPTAAAGPTPTPISVRPTSTPATRSGAFQILDSLEGLRVDPRLDARTRIAGELLGLSRGPDGRGAADRRGHRQRIHGPPRGLQPRRRLRAARPARGGEDLAATGPSPAASPAIRGTSAIRCWSPSAGIAPAARFLSGCGRSGTPRRTRYD